MEKPESKAIGKDLRTMGFHGGERGAGRRGGGTLEGEAGGGHYGGQEPRDPAWGAGKDWERVRRWGSWAGWCHRPTRDQGPPSPGVGLAEKRLGRPPIRMHSSSLHGARVPSRSVRWFSPEPR